MTANILVDCDTGVDDALMLLYLAGSEDANIVAAGSVHGNVVSPRAAINTRYVLDLVGLDHVPVALGAIRPMAQPLQTAEWVHGQDGLGNTNPPPPRNELSEETAVEQMVRLARERPGELTLLASGPLTNLGAALLIEPSLPDLIPRVVVMGGAIAVPGNSTPVAEANIWHDPEAADLVFQAPWEVVLTPLDVTMKTLLQGEYLERLEAAATGDNQVARFAWAILQHYLDVYSRAHGTRASALHDPLAAGLLLHPSLAEYEHLPIHVELRGAETRGMTVADLRRYRTVEANGRPPVTIAMEVQADAFLNDFLDRLGVRRGTSAT